jgi:hypothetical protein
MWASGVKKYKTQDALLLYNTSIKICKPATFRIGPSDDVDRTETQTLVFKRRV